MYHKILNAFFSKWNSLTSIDVFGKCVEHYSLRIYADDYLKQALKKTTLKNVYIIAHKQRH